MENQSIEKIHEKFFNDLVSLGMTNDEALKVSSTFFLSWMKGKVKEKNFDSQEYQNNVNIFLDKLKEKVGK